MLLKTTGLLKTLFIIVLTSSACRAISQRCRSSQFRCRSTWLCVSSRRRCDGAYDCEDGSDEKNCGVLRKIVKKNMTSSCPSDHFTCDNARCVIGVWRCDGDDDCGDMSDEAHCPIHNPRVLARGAIMAISFGAGTVLLLLIILVVAVYYHRHKLRSPPAPTPHMNPLQEITDIMGGVPYHMPVEALLRQPPPRYTSQQDLRRTVTSQINRAFVNDDDLPPPMYSSKVDLTDLPVINTRERPPLYMSHQNLATLDTLNHENMLRTEQTQETYITRARSLNTSFDDPVTITTTQRSRTLNDYRTRRRRAIGRISQRRRPSLILSAFRSVKRRLSRSVSEGTNDVTGDADREHTTASVGDNESFFHVTPRALVQQYERAANDERHLQANSGSAETAPDVEANRTANVPANQAQNARVTTRRKRRINTRYRNLNARLIEMRRATLGIEPRLNNSTNVTESSSTRVRFHPLDRHSRQHWTLPLQAMSPLPASQLSAGDGNPSVVLSARAAEQAHAHVDGISSQLLSEMHRKRANTVSGCCGSIDGCTNDIEQPACTTHAANYSRRAADCEDVTRCRDNSQRSPKTTAMLSLSAGALLHEYVVNCQTHHDQQVSSSSPETLDAVPH